MKYINNYNNISKFFYFYIKNAFYDRSNDIKIDFIKNTHEEISNYLKFDFLTKICKEIKEKV